MTTPAPVDHGALLTAKGGYIGAPEGVLGITEALREKVAIFEDGSVFVQSDHLHAPEIYTLMLRVKLHYPALGVKKPVGCDTETLRDFYGSTGGERHINASETRAKVIGFIKQAAALGINDVQFTLRGALGRARFQKDGFLSDPVMELSAAETNVFFSSLFTFADQGDMVEQGTADQEFSITNAHNLPEAVHSIRCKTASLADGRHLNMRFIYRSSKIVAHGLAALGLLPEQLNTVYFAQGQAAGLFTIAGPTESGKSTTLDLILDDLVKSHHGRILPAAVDDPPEAIHPHTLQLVVNNFGGNDHEAFAAKVRTSLRINPSNVKVGECRSLATATTAIEAANTGKLIFSTLHTTEALQIPFRYMRLGISAGDAFDPRVHLAWMSQRRIPKLCPMCRIPLSRLPDDLEPRRRPRIGPFLTLFPTLAEVLHIRGPGCETCRSQVREVARPAGLAEGRVLVAEIVLPDRPLCQLLKEDRWVEARRHMIQAGFPTLRLHTFALLKAGLIGVEEAMQAVASASEMVEDLMLQMPQAPSTIKWRWK